MKKLIFILAILFSQAGFSDVIYVEGKDIKNLETDVVKIKDEFSYYNPTPAIFEMSGLLSFMYNAANRIVRLSSTNSDMWVLNQYAHYLERIAHEVKTGHMYRTYENHLVQHSYASADGVRRVRYSDWWGWYNSFEHYSSYSQYQQYNLAIRCYKAQYLVIDVSKDVWNSAEISYGEVPCPKE